MKRTVLICTIVCICVFMMALVVQAVNETSEYFTVNVKYDNFFCIGPGDNLTDTFTIENTTDQEIEVRLRDVENVDNSVLYSVLKAGWICEGSETVLGSFDNLATGPNAEWRSLDPGEGWTLTLDMHFPEECGNTYQGTALVANFIFETRILDDEASPQTGDGSDPYLWMILVVVSGCLIPFLLRAKKQNYFTITEGGGNDE